MINNLLIMLGKLFLVRSYRLIFLLICFIPLFFTSLSIYLHLNKISADQKIIIEAFNKFQKNYKKRMLQKNFVENFKKSDPSLVKKNLESLDLMLKEKINLEKIYKNDSFKASSSIKNRLALLKSDNKLSFNEEPLFSNSFVKETLLKQNVPVEISDDDLKNILSLVENVIISKTDSIPSYPQMIIQNFELKKTNSSFILNNLTVLKRDFINEKN